MMTTATTTIEIGTVIKSESVDTYEAFDWGGRTWAIAVRRGSCESLFLLNSGHSF